MLLRPVREIARISTINIAVTALLIFLFNLGAGLWLDSESRRPRPDGALDGRILTPAYTDKERARQIFRDFYRTETTYSPYDVNRLKPFSSQTLNIGPDGLRITPEPNFARPHRIQFFGGSTMWGTGVDDAHTIPALVQNAHTNVQAINHGQSGYVSLQSLVALTKLTATGEPLGTVVFYDGVNDVFHLCQDRISLTGHAFEYFMTQAVERYIAQQSSPQNYAWNASIGNLAALASRLSGANVARTHEVSEVPASRCSRNPRQLDQIVQILWHNWMSAKRLVEANGGRFIAILQPVSSVGTPRRDYLARTDEWDRWYQAAYAQLRDRIRHEGQGFAFDFSEAFDGGEALYIDWAHVNADANGRIAKRLKPIIDESLRRP